MEKIFSKIGYVLIVLMLIFATFGSCQVRAAVYYVDLETGDDSTGTGAWDNPWKSVDKCTNDGATTGGDECRVAKHDSHTTLSGTVTTNQYSTTINTTEDLTGELSAGDFVGLDNGQAWWPVSSVGATTITLTYAYTGDAGSGKTLYKADIMTPPSYTAMDIDSSGTSASSRLKVSGGWTLSASSTQDGVTFIDWRSATGYLSFSSQSFIEFSHFAIWGDADIYSKFHNSGWWAYVHDVFLYRFEFVNTGDWMEADNVVAVCPDAAFFNFGNVGGMELRDSTLYYGTTFSAVFSASTYGNGVFILDNVDFSGQPGGNSISSYFDHVYFYDVDLLDRGIPNDFLILHSSQGVVEGSNIVDCADNGIEATNSFGHWYLGDLRFIDIDFDQITDSEFAMRVSGLTGFPCNISVDNMTVNGGVTDQDRLMCSDSSTDPFFVDRESGANCRNGDCLKVSETTGTSDTIALPIGQYRVTSTASDLTLSIYIKENGSYAGEMALFAGHYGKLHGFTQVDSTISNSYQQFSVTIPSADLTVDHYADLFLAFTMTAGTIYIDDFSTSQ